MSDIVERLRHRAKVGDGWTRPDAAEAADEIERLRGERDAMERRARTYEAANGKLLAECDRLREALSSLLRCTEKHVFGDECKAQRDIARAALGEGRA